MRLLSRVQILAEGSARGTYLDPRFNAKFTVDAHTIFYRQLQALVEVLTNKNFNIKRLLVQQCRHVKRESVSGCIQKDRHFETSISRNGRYLQSNPPKGSKR